MPTTTPAQAPLAQFPKSRPPLPPEFRAIYTRYYTENRKGLSTAAGLAQRLEGWLHRQVAADHARPRSGDTLRTLEVGAGTLNHLPYEPEGQAYDIVEPFTALYTSEPALARIRCVYTDVAEIEGTARYDRIISVATFEHICDLPRVVGRCGSLLASQGELRVAIPSEGTWLWALGWKLTTGLEFRLRYGLDYGVLMRHEHVNTAQEVRDVLGHFFDRIDERVWGLSREHSLYQFYACSRPRLARCTGVG